MCRPSFRYLLLPALLGDLTLQVTEGNRLETIRRARVYLLDYLQRCKSYAITAEVGRYLALFLLVFFWVRLPAAISFLFRSVLPQTIEHAFYSVYFHIHQLKSFSHVSTIPPCTHALLSWTINEPYIPEIGKPWCLHAGRVTHCPGHISVIQLRWQHTCMLL